MKDVCCACGKSVRFSMLLGDTGQRLMDGYACYDCVKLAGYGKGFLSAMVLSATSKSEFLNEYNSSPKVIKKTETEAKKAQKIATEKMNTFNSELTKLTYEQLQNEMRKYIVSNPGIMLQSGELCYFCTGCCSVKYKDVVVGTTRSSTHVGGGRKGLYVGAGSSQQVNNRQIVSEKYPGNFYVTNQRFICNSVKLSFEIPLTKLTSMTTYEDGVTIMSGGKTYNVTFQDVEKFKMMLMVSNEIERRKDKSSISHENISQSSKQISSGNTVKESDVPKLLREYKSLFDEGIISEEEFNQKKTQLLSGGNTLNPVNPPIENATNVSGSNSLEDDVKNKYTSSEKVKAIKYVREQTGWGLKEAKEFVDNIL